MTYQQNIIEAGNAIGRFQQTWNGIEAESVPRMRLQNRFRTGLDLARYPAMIMREDIAAYDTDPANYTHSLRSWHRFIGQQKLISIKKHFGTTKGRDLYLSGWMIAALRSEFGPLPDQSMHEKTSVPALIEELYTFMRQADARELGGLFRILDDRTLAMPDRRGNNRIDSLSNIVRDNRVALLFLIPGSVTTIRMNGTAIVTVDEDLLASFEKDGKLPRSAVVVTVNEIYTQCGRAVLRANLWDPAHHVDPATVPTAGDILKEQSEGVFDAATYDRDWAGLAAKTMW